jgi:RNA polymerase sigma-70 factor (family 1)
MSLKVVHDEFHLLEKVSKGDQQAFALLFYEFHQDLGSYVFRLTKSQPVAEEIVQDVFVKVWTKRDQLNDVKNFRAFLFRVARNQAFNSLRDEARKALLNQEWSLGLSFSEDPGYGVDRERMFDLIDEAIALLPPQQKKAWQLSREDGMKHEEIADRLHLSRETVKRHISLAIAFITRHVKNQADTVLAVLYLLTAIS